MFGAMKWTVGLVALCVTVAGCSEDGTTSSGGGGDGGAEQGGGGAGAGGGAEGGGGAGGTGGTGGAEASRLIWVGSWFGVQSGGASKDTPWGEGKGALPSWALPGRGAGGEAWAAGSTPPVPQTGVSGSSLNVSSRPRPVSMGVGHVGPRGMLLPGDGLRR